MRGLGCFWGLELVRSRETREPLVPFNATGEAAAPVARLAKAALERGLYLMTHWNVVMICPPLTITREELDEGIAILDDCLQSQTSTTTTETCPRCSAAMEWRHGTFQCPRCRLKIGCCEGETGDCRDPG